MLKELSQNIGNCAIHLGIELELDVLAVESTPFAYPRDMFEQNYDILKKWKQHSRTKTLYILMRALQRVMPQGMNFLERKYDLKIGKEGKEYSINYLGISLLVVIFMEFVL